MNRDINTFDVLIIGGGAAGMMAALSVRRHYLKYTVAILDQTFELGRKVLTSGAGRGNITNSQLQAGPDHFYNGNQEIIHSVFSQFGHDDIVRFFHDLGVPTYEEKKSGRGKIFPTMDHAKTLRNMLVNNLKENSVDILCNTRVTGIEKQQKGWTIYTENSKFTALYVIVTGGGKTYPALGSDGSLYGLMESLGHRIIPPVVSAVPLVSKNQLSHMLQGEKSIMEVTSVIDGKERATAIGDVMFTQYGFSGPAIFDVSRDVSVHINRERKHDVKLRFSFFPRVSPEEATKIIQDRLSLHPTYIISHCLWGLFTEKVAGGVCATANILKDRLAKELTQEEFHTLMNILTSYEVAVTDTRGWNEGEFTAGGIDTGEIHSKTLESILHKGLYFAGEILDIDGPVGGFNLSWSWASGWVAGKVQ